jgi:glutamate--cysteine ligase catalytic subunit
MVEGTPGSPYDHQIVNFKKLEANMRLRRKQVQDILGEDEYILSLTSFPMLGCANFTFPSYPSTPNEGVTRSLFYIDQAIYPGHPRFACLSKNIRERRKAKVAINVPIFKDKKTPSPFVEDLNQYGDNPDLNSESKQAAKPDHIYMDAMGFGMGCCCLQMTFQAQSLTEARHLYDQLTPLTPIMLALSAASPIWRGYLADVDCRWNVISGACDDRTREELGLEELKTNRFVIPKSRYASLSCYLSEENSKYNDLNVVKDEEIYKNLLENGIDSAMAQHMAHLFIRDPLVLFKEKLDIDDELETDHFENIQSTNWQTMRFKPPPIQSTIGWRVEFRPTELQISDFENAAFTTFLVLMTRVILSFRLNLVMPLSKVDTNMQNAQKRNACLEQKFYFRRNISTGTSNESNKSQDECELVEMTINEIVNGSDHFPGCIQLILDYLSNLDVDVETQCTIKQYLKLVETRANGTKMTVAAFIRKFVESHPKYNQDSRINDEINYDLMWRIYLISSGQIKCPELFNYF